MLKQRRETKTINVGKVSVGSLFPISIQTMTNTKTTNVKETVQQINQLASLGAEIVRIAVPDKEALNKVSIIKEKTSVPIVADIHFNYQLALEVMDKGVDKLRINPGNIGGEEKFALICQKAKEKDIPIRIGINAGSLGKNTLKKWKTPCSQAMVEEGLNYIRLAENLDYKNIIVSLKAADVLKTIESYAMLSDKTDYPFHIGITESGSFFKGSIKSAVGLGYLLLEGLGDTLRVSLTTDPGAEIKTAKSILQSTGLRRFGPEIISCPTCGRCDIDIISLAEEVEEKVKDIKEPITIAVMGCAVNGPGEAKQADYGIAGGKGKGIIFKNGKIIKKVSEDKLICALLAEIKADEVN